MCSIVSCGKLKQASARRFPLIPEEENPDKLRLVLEPEAAAFYCQHMSVQQRALYCMAEAPFSSDDYLVVDIGGGTVDIVAYQMGQLPETHIEILHEPTGGAWGGRKVNLEFRNFLGDLIGDEQFAKYVAAAESEKQNAKHKAELDEMVEENFESQKTLFGDDDLREDGQISVHLNYSFMKMYETKIEENIQHMEEDIDDSDVRISYARVRMFFDPIVNGIIESITRVVIKVANVYTIYLVGGFGGCKYIYSKLRSHFGDRYKFITPDGHNYVVVKGAAMMRKNPDIVSARRVDATYGVRASIPFVEGKHEEQYRNHGGECGMCSNIFATFVERGDVVRSEYVYQMTFTPEMQGQRRMRVEIYSSSEKDVWYTTGKKPFHVAGSNAWCDVQMIGELIVPFRSVDPNESEDDQAVDVTFDFSSAEIKVSGIHRKSQTEVKVVLNFLEA